MADVTAARELAADSACLICSRSDWVYLFTLRGQQIVRCAYCRLTRATPRQPGHSYAALEAEALRVSSTALGAYDGSRTEREAAESYWGSLEGRGLKLGRVLVLADPGHTIIDVGRRRGHSISTWSNFKGLQQDIDPPAAFDAAIVVFELERANDPVAALTMVRERLLPGGLVLVVTPSLDSLSARMLRGSWTEWRPESLYYFDAQTIQSLLLRSGMREVELRADVRRYSLAHLYQRARSFPQTWVTRSICALYQVIPPFLGERVRIPLPSSAMVATARSASVAEVPKLSVIMPVFNEVKTFQTTLEEVLAKEIEGVRKEVIVVESGSTDGTREIALRYADRPEVRLVLQDAPRGKGNAVRAGLTQATGDYILIQDADQEYDIDDYDALIEALRTYRTAFVLGSRHSGGWKLRKFNDEPLVTALFNVGHLVFLGLFNLLYHQRLNDPFTMFKVFRRDCLHGLRFECNRFDFDFELVIKLVRKGYRPIELPVNYRSRSFKEGKKVSAVRDPLTWLRALIKYRFQQI